MTMGTSHEGLKNMEEGERVGKGGSIREVTKEKLCGIVTPKLKDEASHRSR